MQILLIVILVPMALFALSVFWIPLFEGLGSAFMAWLREDPWGWYACFGILGLTALTIAVLVCLGQVGLRDRQTDATE